YAILLERGQYVASVSTMYRVLAENAQVRERRRLASRAAFPDQATAYRAVFRWANRYNTRRRHSAIGNISPNAYETAYAVTTSATLAEAA
uniref:integrase core domain-containing protein n=1 Tax=Microbacterium sp. TaxID=51671 RepID=UPI0025DEF31A